jgi:AraC-like DNA-binding protein
MQTTGDQIPVADRQKLQEVKRLIEQNFLQEHTLTSLCRQSCLNEFKLKKGFRTLFGTRVIEYVRRLRMEYAQELLRDSHTTVGEASARVGYRYPNHFSTAYKRHFGVTPSRRPRKKTDDKICSPR